MSVSGRTRSTLEAEWETYVTDIICYGKVILELKAVKELNDQHLAQVLNYLKASGMQLGLLVNFGSHPKADCRGVILERAR